jgi:hypothetical protein
MSKQKMDPVWSQLPEDLANKICNSLPQVMGGMNPVLKWEIENPTKVKQLRLLRDNYCRKSWSKMADFMDWWKNEDYFSSQFWETSVSHREYMLYKFGTIAHNHRHGRFYITEAWMDMPQEECLGFISYMSYHDELDDYY